MAEDYKTHHFTVFVDGDSRDVALKSLALAISEHNTQVPRDERRRMIGMMLSPRETELVKGVQA